MQRHLFKKVFFALVTLFILNGLFFVPATFAGPRPNCSTKGISVGPNNFSETRVFNNPVNIKVVINSIGNPGLVTTEGYKLELHYKDSLSGGWYSSPEIFPNPSRQINANWNVVGTLNPAIYDVSLINTRLGVGYTGHLGTLGCNLGTITIESEFTCDFLRVKKENDAGVMCYADSNSCLEAGSGSFTVEAKVLKSGSVHQGKVVFTVDGGGHVDHDQTKSYDSSLGFHQASFGDNNVGNYRVKIAAVQGSKKIPVCTGTFDLLDNCTQCQSSPTDIGQASQFTVGNASVEPYKICDQIDRKQTHLAAAYDACLECVGGTDTGTEGIWTAIGCIKRDPTEIVQNLLRVGLGMGGGVALLMILAAGFLFSISQGDPKRTGEAKELLTAAITGLLFIIFSVVILQFIGYTVLKIPGFGG